MEGEPTFDPTKDEGAITLTAEDAAKRKAILDAGKDPDVVAATEANLAVDNAFFEGHPLPHLPDNKENAV